MSRHQCVLSQRSFCCTTKIQEISIVPTEPQSSIHKKKKPKNASMEKQFFNFVLESNQHTSNTPTLSETETEDPNAKSMSTEYPIDPLQRMPNAGKSSILNRIINHPVSAISSKVNTTRQQTVGCVTTHNIQMELVDTPGILPLSLFHPQRDAKQHTLHYEAWESVYKSDIIIMIIDPTKTSQHKNILICEQLNTLKRKNIDKFVLVINKCDLFWPHTKLHELAALFNSKCKFDVTLIVSAKKRRRIDKLKGYLLSHIGSEVNQKSIDRYGKKWKFESHLKTSMSVEEQILECIRGKIYQRTHQEVPYKVELEMKHCVEKNDKMLADVVLRVKTRSHQNLLNGSAGHYIKRWAAKDLTKLFGKEVVINTSVSMY
eukprot:493804_1